MEQTTMTVGTVDLSLWRGGSGPLLLVLHGDDGLAFSQTLIGALAERFEVVAPEAPGFGTSSRPSWVDRVRDVAELYVELAEALGGAVGVVGCSSLGGWIAAEMGVVASPAGTDGPLSGLVLVSPVGVKFGGREDREFVDVYVMPDSQRTTVMYGDPSARPDYESFSDEQFLDLAASEEATVRYTWNPYLHDPKLVHRLRRVAVPVTVVAGEENRFVLRQGYFDEYASAFEPPARRVTLPGGHRLEEEDPHGVARVVVEFFDSVGAEPVVGAGQERG